MKFSRSKSSCRQKKNIPSGGVDDGFLAAIKMQIISPLYTREPFNYVLVIRHSFLRREFNYVQLRSDKV